MIGAFFEGFLAVEDFTSDTSACFGGSAQTSFAECRRLHQGVEGFGVISLPGFVTGFDLDFSALGYV